jgi:MoxR-like ATPase
MQLDFNTFFRIAKPILDNKFPLLLRGRHGIGKSQVVYQIAAERGLPVIERRASQMTEGDLVGLPVVSGDSTKWNPPDWFKMS